MSKNNWEILTAKNGIEAYTNYQNEKPDLILMDVQMPHLSGIETTLKIRELEKQLNTHIPIIGMTGYSSKSDLKEIIDSGMDECLSKPVDFNELLKIIRKLINNEKG